MFIRICLRRFVYCLTLKEDKMGIIAKYKLKKNLPDLSAGVIFEHRSYDKEHPDRGNIGNGAMVLGWVNGNCQDRWCGDTYVMPGQLAENREWFEPIDYDEKQEILQEIDRLRDRVSKL